MCGIVGVAGLQVGDRERAAVERGVRALVHRGPDSAVVRALEARRSACFLGVARLRIIDLSSQADQPMGGEDGSTWLGYNGEIYNFRELRIDLERAGHQLRSRTDSEVLVHLYEDAYDDPVAILRRLRGMFAFALYDARRDRLLIARDRLGIKPMYVADADDGTIVFGSEVRAVAATGLIEVRPDPAALTAYLKWGVVPAPATVFAEIRELPPGHYLLWENGASRMVRWWSPVPVPDNELAHPAEAARVLGAALDDSITRHLVADRPVGVFLSGGIDSEAVATLAAQAAGRVRALTVTFPDVEGLDEGPPAARIARRIGVDHQLVPVSGDDVARQLPEVLGAMDQPSYDAVNSWLVCGAAREEGFVVCLSGLGGDELFGGYPSFNLVPRVARFQAALGLVPASVRRRAARYAAQQFPGGRLARVLDGGRGLAASYMAVRGLFAPVEGGGFCTEDPSLPSWGPGAAAAGLRGKLGVGFLEMTRYLPNQLLRDTDAVSMSHSLEVRVPLLDDIVVRLALACPERVRFAPNKALLARSAGLISTSAKRPFTLPFDRWMLGPLRDVTMEGVLSDELPFARLLAPGWRKGMWDAFESGRVHWSRPWALAVLRLWPGANGMKW